MDKRGFTLIELLAVIVILGILLIIAVPKISNVIENAQREAYRATNSMIVSELRRRNGLEITPQIYTFTNGVISPDLEITGELPKSGTVEINNLGQIQVVTSNDKYCAIKRFEEDNIVIFDAGDRLCNVVVEVTLTVNPNGGTYNGSTSNTIYQVATDSTQEILTPTRVGYAFVKWNNTCQECLNNNIYTATEMDDTLIAEWVPTYTCYISAVPATYTCPVGTLSGTQCNLGAATANISNGSQNAAFFTVSVSSQCNESAVISHCPTITCSGNPTVSKNSYAWYFLNNNYCNYYYYSSCSVTWSCTTGTPSGGYCYVPATIATYSCAEGTLSGSNCFLYNQLSCSSGWTQQ